MLSNIHRLLAWIEATTQAKRAVFSMKTSARKIQAFKRNDQSRHSICRLLEPVESLRAGWVTTIAGYLGLVRTGVLTK
jgi:hypothetical protein